jgi:Predicted ring-cleavage extradiol dioxygenase
MNQHFQPTMFISGIQQVGIGVSHVHDAFKWYREQFGMAVPIFEEAAEAGLMLPYTGGKPQSRHAILALNKNGGGGMEIWQYTGRTPLPPSFQPQLGDLGIFCLQNQIGRRASLLSFPAQRGVNMLTTPAIRPSGEEHFYAKDPWGNTFEVVSAENWFKKPASPPKLAETEQGAMVTGGVYGALIGVSDMERSVKFYGEALGYDTVVYDRQGQFADWNGADGGFGNYRRVLLRHSEKRKGPFSPLLGETEIELVQCLDRSPRKIFEGRFWGDLGYIHLCFDITGMEEMKKHCSALGHPFTIDSSGSFDMGEAAGYFSYIEDPDGTLVEFVETHKIPILKKIGWYLDLRKRKDPAKPLPRWMLQMI